MPQTPPLTIPAHQFDTNFDNSQMVDTSVIRKIALVMVLLYIFLIPWGNAVWDGFIRIFGMGSLGLAALVVVIHGTHRKYSFFHLFLLMFGSWVMLTLLWSPDISTGKESASTIIQLVFISFVISLLIDTKDKIRLAYQSYVFGTCVGSGIIFYNYMHGIESKYWARYSIENYEPDGVGIMIAIAVPMAAYLTTQYKSVIFRILNSIAIPVCMFAIFLNATRTASIVAMFGIAYWLFTHRKASLRIKAILLAFFVSSIVGVLAFAPATSVDRIFSSSKSISSGTLNGRTAIWSASFQQWEKSPVVGAGIGSIEQMLSGSHVEFNSAHNTYIQVLIELGIIGLLFYLLTLLSIAYYLQKTPANDKVFLITLLLLASVSQVTMNTLYDKEMWFALTMLAIHAHIIGKYPQSNIPLSHS